MGAGWFVSYPLRDEIYLIEEPGQVSSFLIRGKDLSLLIDTGLGIGDIAAEIRRFSPSEPLVINTHAHFDHIGGNHLFSRIGIHQAEATWLEREVDRSFLQDFLKYSLFLRPFPPGFNPQDYSINRSKASLILEHHQLINLGDRTIQVLHTPGHSPGSICLWEEERGILFSGDTVYQGVLFANIEGANLEDYRASAEFLAELAPRVNRIYPSHGPFLSDGKILLELREAFRNLEQGKIPWSRRVSFFGQPALEVDFNSFSLLLPA